MQILLLLFIALFLAYILSEICKHVFRVPRVVGQVVAGLLFGLPMIKSALVGDAAQLFEMLASIGIVLLFFFVGLEISLRDFRKYLSEASLISFFNTALPLAMGFAFSKWLGFSDAVSAVIGICLAVSSQTIAVNFLDEAKMLKSKIGRLIVVTGAVSDILQVLLIGFVLSYLHASAFQTGPESFIFSFVAFVIAAIVFKLYIVPKFLQFFEEEHSAETMFTGGLIIALLLAALADVLGIGSLIGALIAGIIVRHILLTGETRKPWEEHALAHNVHIAAFGFFVPLFFVNVGMNTDVATVLGNPVLTLAITVIALVGTVVGTTVGVLFSQKGSLSEGIATGFGLGAKGDVELVIATLALQSGVIGKDLFSAIIFMALLTTIISPIAFKIACKKYIKDLPKANQPKGRFHAI